MINVVELRKMLFYVYKIKKFKKINDSASLNVI